MLALRWDNVDIEAQTAHLEDTKNGEARTVPLSSRAVAVLEALPRSGDIDGWVFPLTSQAVKRATKRAVLEDLHFHDLRHEATTTLFAALNVLDGQVIGQCQQRHTHAEWLKFLKKIDRNTPKDKTLHLIADNYDRRKSPWDATHKHPKVQEWLAKHPRFNMHFTPTSASWLNMVERFFRDLTVNRLRRGVFTSVPELVTAIGEYVAHHNTQPKPFIWTKRAADILQKVIRANSRLSSKQNEALH
ncbi:Integrase catalytic region [mine drainage metagenome]|uniref:Integrase catalytic region n=3 Tax=mine drainage metagenome TaxID=410659 RepID=T1A6I7_9ZZZZ